MTGLLITRQVESALGDRIREIAARTGSTLDLVLLPDNPAERLGNDDVARVNIAFFSGDVFPERSRGFFAAVQAAPDFQWLHVFHAGVDNPVFGRVLGTGARISTSSGSSAAPIAQTAIAGLLMLARGFPDWLEAQRAREWRTHAEEPDDLAGQVLVVFGLGAIGGEIARLAKALGMRVIGVRRRPRTEADPVDEMVGPDDLDVVLPSAQWLALAAPLTEATRRMIDARRLGLLPRGARILNVGRGELIDEAAMVRALESGQLGGAYLDVFEVEPLPPESPLWVMKNVIVTPHNSAASTGNHPRSWEYFVRNLEAWLTGGELVNEVRE